MRKTHFTAALVMAALSGSLFAQTLVTVNGQAIDSSVIDGQVAALRAENKQIQDSPQLRQELTNRQVISTVIAQEAKRRKLDQSAEFKKPSNKPVQMPRNKVRTKTVLQNRMGGI